MKITFYVFRVFCINYKYYFSKVQVDLEVKINLTESINSIMEQFKFDGQQIIKDFSNVDIDVMISSFKKQLNDFIIQYSLELE